MIRSRKQFDKKINSVKISVPDSAQEIDKMVSDMDRRIKMGFKKQGEYNRIHHEAIRHANLYIKY